MKSATAYVHELSGSPRVDGAVDTEEAPLCWLCARPSTRSLPAKKWQGSSFTDQTRARAFASPWVCEACAYCCAWNPPPGAPAAEPGKKGLNMRLFSHLYDAGEYIYANKGDKRRIREWLVTPKTGPWFAAIADSGQKHTLPWTPVNPGPGGSLFFEEHHVAMGDVRLIDAIIGVLDAGATKAEVQSGDYTPRTLMKCMADVRRFESEWGAERGGRWMDVCVWVAQRTEVDGGSK